MDVKAEEKIRVASKNTSRSQQKKQWREEIALSQIWEKVEWLKKINGIKIKR